ncbi:VCBS repeat-containing protein [Conexibacter sp. JD483]|uniref:FG-GAP repeat domain-containing protein n=1 Tax=unclassified Conexibacter TaxID=2627773 RepID=UPI00271BA36A|nr:MULTISPECIES: VCBS repeat-containing protein [unclassified Conexibacter]MDO8187849.1 VCBS repeat-containing protein [Conexibacter sp. CPCC 205706]MDO8201201.1 VCBS repeat-containing protein [Conexibacter sp. CPCC 205762]MDR9369787.1 VCBS repeat-containing protein [Conexibacter sp. JD483]
MDASGIKTGATLQWASTALLALVLLLAACALGAARAEAISFTTRSVTVPGSGIGAESGLALGDFDADGDLDIAVSLGSGDLSVLLRGADGSYAQAPTFPRSLGRSYAGPMRAVDLNGDGHLDLVALQIQDATSYAIVLLGDGAGGFGTAASIPLTGTPGTMAVGDVTGDGKLDLVLPSYMPSGGPRLLTMPGDGAGGFGAPLASQPPLDGSDPAAIVLADLDADGDLDAAVAHVFTAAGIVTVLRNDGAGGFASVAGSPFDIGSGVLTMAGGDVNGDGRLDLVAPVRTGIAGDSRSSTAGVLLGTGAGGFVRGPPDSFATPPAQNPVAPFAFPLGDLDGDGTLDGAIATDAGTAWPVFGDGAGRFLSEATSGIATGAIATAGTIADVDGDGVLDVVVTSTASPARVFLLINDAEPAISAPAGADLGSAQVGGAATTAAVRIENPGDHGLRVTGLTVAGADAADFAASGCMTAPVPAGSFCDATVSFAPHAAGARAATLTISSSAPSGPATVALTGTATPAPPAACPGGDGGRGGTDGGGSGPAARAATLKLTLRPARAAKLAPGRRLRLTVTVRNAGTLAASAVTLCPRASAKQLTAGRCLKLGRLAAGRSARRTITLKLARSARPGRSYTLTLTARARGARAATARLALRAARR